MLFSVFVTSLILLVPNQYSTGELIGFKFCHLVSWETCHSHVSGKNSCERNFLLFFDSVNGQRYKKVCYYTNWSQYRTGYANFTPDKIDTRLCTHVVFAFAKLVDNNIEPYEWNDIVADTQSQSMGL